MPKVPAIGLVEVLLIIIQTVPTGIIPVPISWMNAGGRGGRAVQSYLVGCQRAEGKCALEKKCSGIFAV